MKVVVEAINVAVDQAVSAADKANASIADIKTVASSTPVAEVLVV